jgi:hypothetical protein
MDIQVNKQQLERVVIKWLNKHYGDLIPKKHKDHPESVFYVNPSNEVMMEYDKETDRVYINYGNFLSKIESIFHLNYYDVQTIMKVWLEETYKLEGVTPNMQHSIRGYLVGRDLQIGGSNTF